MRWPAKCIYQVFVVYFQCGSGILVRVKIWLITEVYRIAFVRWVCVEVGENLENETLVITIGVENELPKSGRGQLYSIQRSPSLGSTPPSRMTQLCKRSSASEEASQGRHYRMWSPNLTGKRLRQGWWGINKRLLLTQRTFFRLAHMDPPAELNENGRNNEDHNIQENIEEQYKY